MNHFQNKNSITLIIACMYAGKSTELIRRSTIYHEIGLKVLYINSSLDTRSSQNFSTHNQTLTQIPFDSVKLLDLEECKNVDDYDVIAIDEGQLFKNLIKFCKHICENLNKIVLVAGLDGDYKRQPFGEICDLIPHCDEIIKLKAFCVECKKNNIIESAIFTKRIVSNVENTILIGGKETYIPVCRKCFNI